LDAALREIAGKLDQAGLVADAQKGTRDFSHGHELSIPVRKPGKRGHCTNCGKQSAADGAYLNASSISVQSPGERGHFTNRGAVEHFPRFSYPDSTMICPR